MGESLIGAEEEFPLYRATVIELPEPRTPGFDYYFGTGALNDHGQFVGTVYDGLGSRAYLWDVNGYMSLAPLMSANDINNSSQVVGSAEFTDGTRAAIWQNGNVTDLGALPEDDTSFGSAINSSGHVAGGSGVFPNRRAFYWDGVGLEFIGEFLTTDINDLNEIVGFPLSGPGVLWKNGVTSMFNGLIINNTLQYPSVGAMWDGQQSICYEPGCGYEFFGRDINENGDVIGEDDLDIEVFIWNRQIGLHHLVDLLDPSDPFSARIQNMQCPDAINNNRQIIISCATVDGIESELGFVPLLLTPVDTQSQNTVSVPIPIAFYVWWTILVLGFGLYRSSKRDKYP